MKKYDVIGLMSGTSLDGLDIAFVRFFEDEVFGFELLERTAVSYGPEFAGKLKNAVDLSALELKVLDKEYGRWIGEKTRSFMDSHGIAPDLIVSHGHTIFHQPQKGITLQIGDGYEIMNCTEVPVVSDLRSLDVSLGGQGAPLVPMGDKLLFTEFEFCLNLGGFSNISFDKNNVRIAFDICPVNTVLNHLALRMNEEYDAYGKTARKGVTNIGLLEQLNALDFYKQIPPKSLGIEWVYKNIYPLLSDDTTENLLNTFCHHIAQQIANVIESQGARTKSQKVPKVLITGGGAKNTFLIEQITLLLENRYEIVVPGDDLIDFKEAIIFALLGLLRYQGKINTFSSVTGAQRDSSGGVIFDQILRQ